MSDDEIDAVDVMRSFELPADVKGCGQVLGTYRPPPYYATSVV